MFICRQNYFGNGPVSSIFDIPGIKLAFYKMHFVFSQDPVCLLFEARQNSTMTQGKYSSLNPGINEMQVLLLLEMMTPIPSTYLQLTIL